MELDAQFEPNGGGGGGGGAVNSVNGKTGTVVLDAGDLEYDDSETYSEGSVGAELTSLKEDIQELSVGVPANVRQAIKALFESGAYADTGLTDEMAVVSSWASQVTAITLNQSSISISGATTSQLTATTTPSGGTVLWTSSDTSIATVSSSGLVTGVSNGTATITASSGNVSATCAVSVSGIATLSSISAVYTQSGTVYNTDSLDSLKTDLVVTATYSDSSSSPVASADYTLSGTLEVGTSTITVTYGGKTDTFNVTVTEFVPEYPKTITTLSDGVGFGSVDPTKASNNPPYIANTGKQRIHCIGADALGYPVEVGKQYSISITSSIHTEQGFFLEFNEDGLEQLENGQNVSSSNYIDGDWFSLTNDTYVYTPGLISSKPVVAVWIGFRKSTSNPTWDNIGESIFPITITELTV